MRRSGRLCMAALVLALVLVPVQGAAAADRGFVKAQRPAAAGTAVLPLAAQTVEALESEPNNDVGTADSLLYLDTGTIADDTDWDDVFAVPMAEGTVLEVMLIHDFGTGGEANVDLYLYPPGTTTVDGSEPAIEWSFEYDVNREYFRYVIPPGGAGTYFVDVYAYFTDGEVVSYTLRATEGIANDFSGAERYWGMDRFETCAEIAYETFPEGITNSAVLANGRGFADALSGSGLAGAIDGPVLLTEKDSLPEPIEGVIDYLGVTDVYIIGGTGAVSQAVEDYLVDDLGLNVERIQGADRYATALAVANRMMDADMYMAPPGGAFVVNGTNWPDALAASPFSYTDNVPILLTRPEALNSGVETFLQTNVDYVWVVGGTGAVSDAAGADAIAATDSGGERVAGATRYETARLVAQTLCSSPSVSNGFGVVGFATGWNFPDALAGGAAMGYENGCLALTQRDFLNPDPAIIIQDRMTWGNDAVILGGEGAVSFNAAEDIWYELASNEP